MGPISRAHAEVDDREAKEPEYGSRTPWLKHFVFRAPHLIPPREFLYGTHYARRYLSTTFGPGGGGKSSLSIVEVLAMATGRPLLGIRPTGQYRVAYWNGEDPLDEIERRIGAAILHFGLDGRALQEWLFWGSGREEDLIIAEQTREGTTIHAPVVNRVTDFVRNNRIDAVIIDPFVSSHRVTENDNGSINQVAKTWAMVGENTNAAIELNHHTRKGSGQELTVEDGRGAVALLAAARSARVINPMTNEQATKAGVENRRAYFQASNGKANLAPPPDKGDWYRFESKELGNGDSVGVVTGWSWPDPFDDVNTADVARIQQAIEGGQWRENIQSKEWVGYAVGKALDLDIGSGDKIRDRPAQRKARAKVKGLIKTWLPTGVLATEMMPDQKRNLRPHVVVGTRIAP